MRDHLPGFRAHLLAQRRSPRTVKTYGAVLALFFAFAEMRPAGSGPSPTLSEVEIFLGRPRLDGLPRSVETFNQELSALRGFAVFAKRTGLLSWTSDPTEGLTFLKVAPKDPPVLQAAELRRLFMLAADRPEPGRSRNLALLALLSQLGLRVHEVVGLDVGQVDLPSATLVSIKGKGGTEHDLPLNAPSIILLTAWLGQRRPISAPGEPALFVNHRGTRLTARSVERLLVDLRVKLGSSKKITPHTLRHSAATLALTMGTDLATVGELLRHADLNTTRRYLHLVDERRREAVRKLGATVPAELLEGVAQAPATVAAPTQVRDAHALFGPGQEAAKKGIVDHCDLDDAEEAAA
jgi:integrase/recombinase XerC